MILLHGYLVCDFALVFITRMSKKYLDMLGVTSKYFLILLCVCNID